jgi:hypothetical protein
MAMEKLIRKLRRELARNPKKSALLGGAILLAIYFWAPLVAKWVTPEEKTKASSRSAAKAPSPSRAAVGDRNVLAAQTRAAPAADWRELARRLEEDPLHTLAGLSEPVRDPFFRSPEPAARETTQPETQPLVPEKPAPRSLAGLGLKVEGLVIGRGLRAAIINGTLCRENEPVALPGQADGAPEAGEAPRPVLTEVRADYVVIRMADETLRLEVERSELAPGDRIAPAVGRDEF